MEANEYKRVWANETAKIQQLQDENDKLRSELNTGDNEFQSIWQSWRDEQTKNKQLQADKEDLVKIVEYYADVLRLRCRMKTHDNGAKAYEYIRKHQYSIQEG